MVSEAEYKLGHVLRCPLGHNIGNSVLDPGTGTPIPKGNKPQLGSILA